MRKFSLGVIILPFVLSLSGCFLPLLGIDDSTQPTTPDPINPITNAEIMVDWADKATGARLAPGMDAVFTWNAAPATALVRLDIFRNGIMYFDALLNYATNSGTHTWTVPLDIILNDTDLFKAKLTVYDPNDQSLIVDELYSAEFQIARGGSSTGTGLSDVTVNANPITVTLTDDGSVEDGDRVDIYLNGVKIISDHSLRHAGDSFSLNLLPGTNELRVTALNEGTTSPNTAKLEISNVTIGEAVQSWRLLTSQTGSLLITCTVP